MTDKIFHVLVDHHWFNTFNDEHFQHTISHLIVYGPDKEGDVHTDVEIYLDNPIIIEGFEGRDASEGYIKARLKAEGHELEDNVEFEFEAENLMNIWPDGELWGEDE